MKSNTQLLAVAVKQLGNTGGKYRSYVHASGSWCDMFVFWLYDANGNGSLIPWKGQQRTYCPASIKWCDSNLAQIPPYLAMACDIIYYDWDKNGVPNHIGIVESKVSTSTIKAIEGNTSGGKVARKTRDVKYVCGIYRPHFTHTFNDKRLAEDGDCQYQTIGGLQKTLKILGYYSGSIDCILGKSTVRAIQRLVGCKDDGAWGATTSGKFQQYLKNKGYYAEKVDKAFGEQSVLAMQKWINNNAYQQKPASKPAQKPTPKPTAPTRQKMSKIGHARADYDHKAGDSSGKEVCKTAFTYKASSSSPYNWTYVFRPKNIAKANKSADMCEKAIANNNIGYNSNGETAYGKAKAMTKLASAVNYDLSKIKTKCGLSCGDLICLCNRYAGLSKCYKGSGKALAEALKKNSNFQCYRYKKGMQLYRGDVLITAHSNGKHNHVVMCL